MKGAIQDGCHSVQRYYINNLSDGYYQVNNHKPNKFRIAWMCVLVKSNQQKQESKREECFPYYYFHFS